MGEGWEFEGPLHDEFMWMLCWVFLVNSRCCVQEVEANLFQAETHL